MVEAPKEIQDYFETIDQEVSKAYKVANKARKKGHDPENIVNIPLAKNMAERVEGLISSVTPKLKGTGMVKRIFELEKEYGSLDWRVALKIAEEVAKGRFCKFESRKKAMEIGIRVGFAYNTVGVVAAPLEGFMELSIKKRADGEEYVSPWYSGPIRGAGGTAAAFSVVLSDYVRTKMGYQKYDPTEEEVKRYVTEINDYHERATNLQYLPSEKEIEFLIKHIPVEINGSPTEKIEVSNYKDLPRIETNKIRGGICLVIAEGVAQKAKKLWKRINSWGKEFDLEWFFLKEFLKLQDEIKSKGKKGDNDNAKITPNHTFVADLVAGRPVLTMPMAAGGFRLRYGRTRTTGFSASAIHPATMEVLDNFVAIGTQLKVERPGKAASMSVCDSIDGPIVRLKNGDVIKLDSLEKAKKHSKDIEKILFLGDILFNYGDFSENGHKLVPSGYCIEWYVLEMERAIVNMFGSLDTEKVSELINISADNLTKMMASPFVIQLTIDAAIEISKKLGIPLAPDFTPFFSLINKEELLTLLKFIIRAKKEIVEEKTIKLIFHYDKDLKDILEKIGLEHKTVSKEFIVLSKTQTTILMACLGLEKNSIPQIQKKILESKEETTLEILNTISEIKIYDKSGTFIGARMGRPEKAKMRKLTGSPQVLFPVGDEGGRLRSFQAAIEEGAVTSDFPIYGCSKCNTVTIYPVCETCGKQTHRKWQCPVCGEIEKENCPKHGPAISFSRRKIPIKNIFNAALNKLGIRNQEAMIKGVRGTSNKDHIPENIIKGIIRAKHDLYVNKDGTIRYDMTEMPITHFKPKEIGTPIKKLNEMGYLKDIKGKDLISPTQLVEIRPQDVILPSCTETLDEKAPDVMYNITKFIDELLIKLYDQEPYYNLENKEGIVGHLIISLAPHTSAGVVSRIIGFSKTQAMYAHPLLHAAMRRDCDGDEAGIMLLMDGLLNFSRQFLPNKIGTKSMDAPLVLTSQIIPAEVDDMIHGMDVVWSYPLEFYEAALEYKQPWDIKIQQLNGRLGTEKQYSDYGFTHSTSNINLGVLFSDYKRLPTMEEKLKGQMRLAEKISAVNETEVAKFVIEKHFIKDTKGNLRKFSQQRFRCVACSEKYRRPPLNGVCRKCGGRIIFTISEGSVIKYLEPSISLAQKYNVPTYLKQTLEILQLRVDEVFGKDKEKQEGLGKWF